MQLPIEVWQGCSGYWQSAFIRENLLPLGHVAWQGYRAQGRGLVACDVKTAKAASVNWSNDMVTYQARYIPAAEVPDYFKVQSLKADYVDRLMDAVQTYRPEGELLIAIAHGGSVEINWLRNLTISPPDCYRQVCNRWDEFTLDPRSGRRCNNND
ncbi:hypothetical protein C7293_20785 [filamentous cyanobacterium CCT1]|nr:hypothetical protein C7293_20785 [filamentous cyanobacterium CCT1]PSN78544.1 hypothetical protein C8B47_16320 [filamentous cyanobacterium CCP4]